MSTRNICNICGANYEYRDGKWRCPACGAYKPEELSNEEETLLYNAAQKLRLSAFDDAEELYRDITVQYPKNSRGYWGLVLAKYGIKYEKDYDGKMIPSCYAASYESVLNDNNYKKAQDFADKDNKKYYQDQANKIEKVRSEWIEIADHEEPYDVFISYKDSDKENGTERTQDSYDAGELYSFLKDKGYRVFFSRESLKGKEGEKYEPYIFNALNTAQVMIVYGTKPEYIEATWVKNEWMRYYKRILRSEKQKNSLILAYKGFNPSVLPKPLSGIQGFDMGCAAIGFGDIEVKVADIINSAYKSQKIKRRTVKARKAKAAEKLKRVETVEVGKVAAKGRISRENINRRSIGGKEYKLSASAEKILNIADKYLAQGIFDEAEKRYNDILQSSPRNGRALVGKLLAVTGSTDLTDFENGGAGRLREVSLIDNVLACAEKESAEKILSALCREVVVCFFDDSKILRAKQIVSVIKDYDSPAVADMRVGLLDSGLNILGKDSNSAKYFIDIYLTFEEDDKSYVNGLHKAAQRAISNGDFDTAGYYLNTLKSVDPSSFDTQICLIEAEYKVKTVDEVINRIESERAYGRAEMIVALLDKLSAEKWLGICLDEAEYLIDGERFVGAQRWIELSAKYNFNSREEKLKTLLEKCIRRASEKSAECFESILNYVADGNDNVYVKNAMNFAETARSNGSFSCAKSIYGKIMAVLPDYIPAVYGRFYADIGCASERGLSEKIGNITDWACFEDVLSVQTEDADDLFWIKKLCSACIDNVKKYKKSSNKAVFGVFEKLLSYIPEKSNDEMLALLAEMAAFCVEDGLFVEAARYYGMYISEDPECASAHWGALLAKLRCSNEEELARQPVPIGDEEEFKAAQVCAAENEDLLNHYITVHGRQMNIIKAAQKRRRIIRISAIASACVVVAGAALGSWFTYYNSQNRLIYSLTDEGYAVSAGKFYKAESLVIPDEYEGLAVVAVADSAFSGHSEIESVVLPESLISIGDGAFSGCANLSSVTVAEQRVRTAAEYYASGGGLEYVGDGAFDGCTALEEFSFEYGLEYIGDRAFAGAAFTQVSLPATVGYVGGEAFSGCERLSSIIVGDRDEVPVNWADNWRDGCNASVDFRLRVVFDYNGATDGDYIAESYVSYNGEFDFIVPERKGYVFDGWFRGETRVTDAKGASLSAWQFNDGGIITAHWAPNINSVVFNANGGEGEMPAQKIATDESAQLSANMFTRKGYTFAGWAENATGSVVYKDGAQYTMGAESSYELFAVWSANRNEIVFDGNGATSGGTDTQYIYTGSSASLTDNGFKRDGYDFVGWSTAPDGRVEYADGQSYIMGTESSYTLYAVWEPHGYSIDYELNGGSVNGINPVIYSIESDDIILSVPTRAGYTFIGWTGTDIAEPQLSVIIPKGSFGNRTYKAVWSANTNKVYFNANGGEGEMSAQEIKTDITAPLTANVFTRAGYAFSGWATERNGDVVYADKANYTMSTAGEYTLYAVWSVVEYTISYDLSGGSLEGVNPAVYTVESAFTLTNPIRGGYTFAGWTGTDLAEPTLAVTVVQGNVGNREYKAVWEAKTNKVIFHANGGEGEMSVQGIKTDEATVLSANLFTRKGYSFIGWATSENGEVAYNDGENYIMGTQPEYNLYAVWKIIEYSIAYTLNGGAISENPEIFTVMTPEFTLNNPVREGYTFIGWSGTGIDGLLMTVTIPANSTGDREYAANWQANENMVIFHANGGNGNMPVQLIKTDETAVLNDNAFERPGYMFIGWAEEPEGEVSYADGADYVMGTLTEYNLYAVWTPNLNEVRFDGNGADGGEMAAQTGYTDSELVLSANTFKRKGYQFVGWSVEKDGKVVCNDGEKIVVGVEPTVTLYAKWQALSYNVFLISQDADFANVSVTFDSEYIFGVPKRHGYVFGGWYSLPGGGGAKFTDEEGNGVDVWSYDGDIMLYACWLGTDGLVYTSNEDDTYSLTGLTDTELDEVYIPEYFDGKPVTAIAENAFANGGNITEIVVPDSIQTIEKGAFTGCTALESLTLPFVGNTREAEGEEALLGWLFSDTQTDGCTLVYQYYSEYGMAFAYIPDSLAKIVVTDAQNIGYGAFSSVRSLQSVSVTANALGARAFYDCASLANVELCEDITEIGQSAFGCCVALKKVIIPNSVQSIGRYAFDECAALTSLTLPFIGANASASGAEGVLGYLFGNVSSADMVSVNQSSVTAYFPARLDEIVITGATQIAANALRGLTMLKNISWNDGITSIGDYALYGCMGVETLTLPSALQKLGNYAFYNVGISVLELPQGVVSLGTYALYGSELRTLLVPASVVVSLGDKALENTHSALKIYVTDALLNSYKSSWSDYSSRIYSFNCIRENGMAIDDTAFLQYFGEETEVALPANVTSIGAYAFAGTNVCSVLVPGNVRKIGTNAFSGCDTLESVRMLSGVITISANAFYGATCLKGVEIPNTVTSIGASAFYGCSSLREVVVPECVTAIESSTFYGCSSLREVVIPNSVTSIEQGAFRGCNSLVKMTLPFVGADRAIVNVNSWEEYRFGYIFGHTTHGNSTTNNPNEVYQGYNSGGTYHYYYIPDSLREVIITDATGISAYEFYNCDMLTSIMLNEGMTVVYDRAFYNCDGVTEMVIPESVTSIGTYAFANCGDLAKVTLPSGLTKITDCTFQNCGSLTSVNGENEVIIGVSVTSIGAQAFANCSLITSVTMQGVVTSIGAQAFDGCDNLVRINSETAGKVILKEGLESIGTYAFRGLGKITEAVVPDSVTSIGQGAFQGCNSLVKMTLPFVGGSRSVSATAETSSNISHYLFGYFFGSTTSGSTSGVEGAVYQGQAKYSSYYRLYYIPSNLRKIVITEATGISANAFYNCTMLTSITLNEGITAINAYAFYNCANIAEIVIPSSVESIGNYAFQKCSLLQTVQVLRGDVLSLTSLGSNVFDSTPATLLILVPDDAYSAYITAANWSTYADKIRSASASEDGFIIENGVLLHYIGTAETVTIPAGVTSIGDYAFAHNYTLKQLIIGNDVVIIGDYAFYQCLSLQSVVIGDSVQTIESFAFDQCISLQSVVIGDGIQIIARYAFYGCASLQSVTYGSNLQSIGEYAFADCPALSMINSENPNTFCIGDSVTSIGVAAFMGCNSLHSIVLPFVGADSTATAGYMQVFGYIFGYTTSSTAGTIEQVSGYYYYIPASLTSVVITQETSLVENAFTGCANIVSIEFDVVQSIADYAFYGCDGLVSLTIRSQIKPPLSGNVFNGGKSVTVYVAKELVEQYQADEEWGKHTIIAIS